MTSLINPLWHLWIEGGNLGKIPFVESKPDGEKLDPAKIEEFFGKKLKEYCQIVLNSAECPVYETKGCGLNSFCGENEDGTVTICEDDDNLEVGYKCVEPSKYLCLVLQHVPKCFGRVQIFFARPKIYLRIVAVTKILGRTKR